jgi:DNA polymerase-4
MRVMASFVLHVDLDQFIAAVEVLRRPELAGREVVVGGDGDPSKRGVVSTASYEARAYGVRSGMPLRTAYRRCPQAVFLPVDAPAYLAASREVMAVLRSFPAVVEVMGWDEAFMAVETDAPEAVARHIQQAVRERTGLSCSVGIGDNKLRAKMASGFAKPGGVVRLVQENWAAVTGRLPTEALWGIGAKTARKLAVLGIRTVAELAAADEGELVRAFGPATGPWLRRLGTGEVASPVTDEPHRARGRGKERTFQEDVRDGAQVKLLLSGLARELAQELSDIGRPARRVAIKVRFAPFDTYTRSVTLPGPTLDPDVIAAGALAALERLRLDRPVRLLGVRAELVEDPSPGNEELIDT